MATTTTSESTIKPRIIGLGPIFLISLKLVVNPIADKAMIMLNFDALEIDGAIAFGIIPMLRKATTTRNKMMKYGNIFRKSTGVWDSVPCALFSRRSLITEKISTYGMMNSVCLLYTSPSPRD